MSISGSKLFSPCRTLGYVSNHLPLQVRYVKRRKEYLVTTCAGRSIHTYGISHFSLLNVGALHSADITCISSDTFHVYTATEGVIYAWRRSTEATHTYQRHLGEVIIMLPFGPHLISIDDKGYLKVWDIKSESLFLQLTFNCEDFRISAVAHPSTYINKLLLGSEQGSMQLWNLNHSKLVYAFKGWNRPITVLAQAPAIDVVAVGLNNGAIILHNLRCDETIMKLEQEYGPVTAISFRTDCDVPTMATGSVSGHIVFWDLEKRQVSSQLFHAHHGRVAALQCLPNEPLMLSSSPDNTLKLWIFDLSGGGARLLRLREGHSKPPTYLRFHGSNGENILSCSPDSSLRIYNLLTEQFNKSLGRASYNRKASKRRRKHATPEDNANEDPLLMPPIIEFTSETTREKEWDNIAAIHENVCQVTTWSYHKLKMGDLKFVPERFRKTQVKDVTLRSAIATAICMTHCGHFVIIGYSTGHVDRFNIQSGIWRATYGRPSAHSCAIRGLYSDQLNKFVVTAGGTDGQLRFWQFAGNKIGNSSQIDQPFTHIKLPDCSIGLMRFHRESALLAIATEDFDIYIIATDTRRIVRHFKGHRGAITALTFSPDSRWLVSASMDRSVRTWHIPSALLIDQFAIDRVCVSLDISPNGSTLATAHVDLLGICLWSNKTLYKQHVTLTGLCPNDEPPEVIVPMESIIPDNIDDDNEEQSEVAEQNILDDKNDNDLDQFDNINDQLIRLSGVPESRWSNVLNIDAIRRRNRPTEGLHVSKSAPFFLPTITSLSGFDFNLNVESTPQSQSFADGHSLLVENFTQFGKMLENHSDNAVVLQKLKTMGPVMLDFEVRSLCPHEGGSINLMLSFLQFIQFMIDTQHDFELAQAYLAIFLKHHGRIIGQESELSSKLHSLLENSNKLWQRLEKKVMYNLCVLRTLKID